MRSVLDRLTSLFSDYRDYVILALAILVLVEGAIIVLWARRAVLLRRSLDETRAEAERSAAKAAASLAVARNAGTYRVGDRDDTEGGVIIRDGERKIYSPGRTNALPPAPSAAPARAGATTPDPAPAPHPTAAPEEAPAAPAEYTTPVAQQAAAWVLPDVEASHAAEEPSAELTPTRASWVDATQPPAPTTLGWSGTSVPVEPAPDFAVITDPDAVAGAPVPAPAPTGNGNGKGNGNGNGHAGTGNVLRDAVAWATPVTPAEPPAATPPAPVWDLAMLDSNDDPDDDDAVGSGDLLLVEDDATITRLYRMLLESRGYTVRLAADGLEGLDRVNERRPDLVLLDIMMPRMNGIAFLQALRAGSHNDVPVVVLSNFMEKELVDDAMSLGAIEYMVKAQTRPEALAGALPHWLRGERAFSA